jgi:glycosyltransferase involved in cell wall biosynthesis
MTIGGSRSGGDGISGSSRHGVRQELVSVIIPCYNQAHFLSEAIESVLCQSYQNFELLVVDDGSKDDTPKVASEYASQDSRVRLIGQQNRGLAGARNRGLAESQGEYVVFLDSDDRLLGEALEIGVRELASHPECAFVSGRCTFIAADGSPILRLAQGRVEGDPHVELLRAGPILVPAVMYRRAVFGVVGGFDESYRAAEDYALYYRVAGRFPILFHDTPVAEVRRHEGSMTRDFPLMLRSNLGALRTQRSYVKKVKHLEEAYRAGIKFWLDCYAFLTVSQTRARIERREWLPALDGILALLRYYPRGLPMLANGRGIEKQKATRWLATRKQELRMSEERLRERRRQLHALKEQDSDSEQQIEELKGDLAEERRKVRGLRKRVRRRSRRLEELEQGTLPWLVDGMLAILRRFGGKPGTPPATPTVALLPWGNVLEDYLDGIGISLDEFCNEYRGTWMFGYVDALERVGVRTVLVVWSREVDRPQRRVHVPTGTKVWVLPPARAHSIARRLRLRLERSDRSSRSAWRSLRLLTRYTATPPRILARVLREEGCSALIVQEYEYARYDVCLFVGKLLGLPVLATFQGGRPEKTRSLEGWIRKRTVSRAAGLLVGPRREARAVRERYGVPPETISVVANPIDTEEWHPEDRAAARAEMGLPQDAAIACWHGRIDIRRKGLDILVKAWKRVCQERPDADLRLLLCGGGAGNEKLRNLMEEADLRGVHWHDEYTTDRSIVRRQLAASDLFVFPSRHEGFAVAPMEAMSCGRAVVACDAPGVADLLEGQRSGGIVVGKNASKRLAQELGRLLDDRELACRMGQEARRRIEESYSPEAIGEDLLGALHRAKPEYFPDSTIRP